MAKAQLIVKGHRGVFELEIPDGMTVADFHNLKASMAAKGWDLKINGKAPEESLVATIESAFREKGVTVRVNAAPAEADTPIGNDSLVVVSGEQKGGFRLVR